MMRIKFMLKQFLKEPFWFKVLIIATLVSSILFSSSFFSGNVFYQSLSKLSAAIFFTAYGLKFWFNRLTSGIFVAAAVLCIYLSINVFF
ncbi:hypothetical protein DRW41_08390 [Neobacillus piezotolerans]|uniref:Uncharacterized protein n=1 Tax=Neobacillus piezotolerans TaxID=2259171 RepID=A0A3D8GTW2_9BACI|nr:hypothetical protein [Neobacillus piezotolerans]RDU37827.1 hypothetical protein DRW41_08390 [Neobacillus piezotolerans]